MRGVLTQPRRRLRLAELRGPHPVGVARLLEAVAWIAHKRAPLLEVVQRCDVGAVGNRRVGNSERRCEFADLVDRVALDPRVDLVGVDVGLLGDRQRRFLVDPLRVADHRAQVEPLLRGPAPEVHQTVLRLGHTRHGESPGVSPGAAEHFEVGDGIVGQTKNLCFQHRQVEKFPRATAAPAVPRRQVAALA